MLNFIIHVFNLSSRFDKILKKEEKMQVIFVLNKFNVI